MGEDAARDRLYLAVSRLARLGIPDRSAAAVVGHPLFARAWTQLAEEAAAVFAEVDVMLAGPRPATVAAGTADALELPPAARASPPPGLAPGPSRPPPRPGGEAASGLDGPAGTGVTGRLYVVGAGVAGLAAALAAARAGREVTLYEASGRPAAAAGGRGTGPRATTAPTWCSGPTALRAPSWAIGARAIGSSPSPAGCRSSTLRPARPTWSDSRPGAGGGPAAAGTRVRPARSSCGSRRPAPTVRLRR